jgi:hypothetical protein
MGKTAPAIVTSLLLVASAARLSAAPERAAAAVKASVAATQTLVDGILARFGNGDIVTMSDVHQARLLKLVEPSADSDPAYVDAIINRRLMLSDLKRNPPAEPTSEAIESRYQQWIGRLGANPADLLRRAGMSEAGLRGWIRDDLRLQAYVDERFGTATDRSSAMGTWVAMLRQRAGLR